MEHTVLMDTVSAIMHRNGMRFGDLVAFTAILDRRANPERGCSVREVRVFCAGDSGLFPHNDVLMSIQAKTL